MKSKKKLLLMGVGVMGALAMGVGATSTFAWYTATVRANTDVSTAAMTEDVHGSQATIDAITLYAKFSINTSDSPKLTTSDGYCFAIDNNGKIADAQEGNLNTRYGTATVAFEGWYTNAAGTSEASEADINQIVTGSLSLDISGGNRTRVSKTQPANDVIGTADDNSFDEVFSALGGKVSLTVTITESAQHDAAPSVSIEQSGAVYFSVAGETPDQTKAQMDAKIGTAADADTLTGVGAFTQTLTVAKAV